MNIKKIFSSLFQGSQNNTRNEIIRLIEEIESERRKHREGSPSDKKGKLKIAVLLDLADRLNINIKN